MKNIIVMLYLAALTVSAETVTWRVMGTVNSASGGFSTAGVAAGQEVEVEFSYNSEADFRGISSFIFSQTRDHFDEINLLVNVTINGLTWSGTLESGIDAGLPRTFLVTESFSFPLTESVQCLLDEVDGASMTSFPQSLGGGKDAIQNNFNGLDSDPDFVNDGIASSNLNATRVGEANGVIRTEDEAGTEQNITYTLDVSTLSIMGDEPPPATPEIELELVGNMVSISWMSEENVNYRVLASQTLTNFSPVALLSGDGGMVTATFQRVFDNEFYRVQATPAP